MSAVVMADLETVKAAMRDVYREERARELATVADHSPTDRLEPKVLAAERGLTCSDSVTKALKAGRIPGKKIGGRWEIIRGEVCACPMCRAWLAEQRK